MVLHHLAMLRPVQRGLDGRDRGWRAEISIEAARWARFVRTRIASVEVSTAIHRTVARP
jgi:hypothetical protein